MTTPDVLYAAGAEVAEGPAWDAERAALIWVDITRGEVHSLVGAHDELTYTSDETVGAALPSRDGGQLIAVADRVRSWPGDEYEARYESAAGIASRFNDAKCDPRGRPFFGTVGLNWEADAGEVVTLSANGIESVAKGFTLTNGIGWSPDGTVMYVVDSVKGHVRTFEYDLDGGRLGAERDTLEIAFPGMPDGLSVDDEGCLWVAMWDGGCVRRFSAGGEFIESIDLPVSRVTSVAFGGSNGRTMYVTTASLGLSDAERAEQPHAGAIFAVDPGVSGPVAAYLRRPG